MIPPLMMILLRKIEIRIYIMQGLLMNPFLKNNDDDATVNDYTVENNKNENIDDVGVTVESIPEKNNNDESTGSGISVQGIFE